MKRFTSALMIGFLFSVLVSCGNEQGTTATQNKDTTKQSNGTVMNETTGSTIKEEPVSYSAGDVNLKSYVAYNDKIQDRRPVVLVVPEWWGLTDYPRMRAKMLAEMGYLAMAVDMYGDGKIAANPQEAQTAAGPFYGNPQMGKERLDAALAKAKSLPQADTTKVVAIGYCFGGGLVLNYAKMGAPVLGVVSFHGTLQGVPPQKGTKAQFLVCHGGADNLVPGPQVTAFKKSMDSAGVVYTFKVYEGAKHAFTNPDATENGKKFNMPIGYNEAADKASWNDMKIFFATVFK